MLSMQSPSILFIYFTWSNSRVNVLLRITMLLLLVKIKLATTLFQNWLDFPALKLHILLVYMRPTDWTHIVCLEPSDNALMVECVPHITSERGHLITLWEVHHAHDAIVNSPEASLVIGGLRRELDDALTRLVQSILLGTMRAELVDKTWAEDCKKHDGNYGEEGSWQCKADYDGKDC